MPAGAPLAAQLDSWQTFLEGELLSENTIELYLWTAHAFIAWLDKEGLPSDTEGVDAPHIQAWLASEAKRERMVKGVMQPLSAETVSVHRRNLCQLFAWLIAEHERTAPDPMERVGDIHVPKKIKPVLSHEQLKALLRACEGQGFEERRDTALISVLYDTAARVSGIAGLRYLPDDPARNDVHVRLRQLRIVLKGGDQHVAPIGRKTAAAVDRYIRARARHPQAEFSEFLWLGRSGRATDHMTRWGIAAMLDRRGKRAGIENLTPHWFRRTGAHDMLAAGMQEGQVMAVAGWKTTAMLRRYTEDLAAERARVAHSQMSPMDLL